ncbi:choline ABC transporter, permease protein [Cedecea neteri]|uniref:Choline ABC transporter, permease protein n=1 Tax=Cedecea neteri TaxID=158822 RepID=A0A2X3L3P8_9ENTR|nr:choline ABC transporter, permease protein [Cedecea neteri]
METLHYMIDNAGYIGSLTLHHLWLVLIAVGLAILIGVPLGILIVRHKWLATPILGFATILLTIPSVALFGLMIPLFSLIGQGYWRGACRHGGIPLLPAADCAQHPHRAGQPAAGAT